MKKILILIILFNFYSKTIEAQYFFNFNESSSFYNESFLLQSSLISREVITVGQMKNDHYEDSIKIYVYNANHHGNIVSSYFGSKWGAPVLIDSIKYNDDGSSVKIPLSQLENNNNNDLAKNEVNTPEKQFSSNVRYEYDSLNKVKKVFEKMTGYPEILSELIYYDEQNRVKKIDFEPQSERVHFKEYVYKKNKIKVYNNTGTTRECYETIELNDKGQISQYEFTENRYVNGYLATITYDYDYSYFESGLVSYEVGKVDGKTVSIASHHYYR